MNDEQKQTLQLSAGLIFSLQDNLPNDLYTPYDAQKAQEGLMRIHNLPIQDTEEQNEKIEELTYELEEAYTTIEELKNDIEDKDRKIEALEEADSEERRERYYLEQKVEELEDKLQRKYADNEKDELIDELTDDNKMKDEMFEECQRRYEEEKQIKNKYILSCVSLRRINEELKSISLYKSKYVNRNPLCLFCGTSRYDAERDKYKVCPLLRDCFTCKTCGDKKFARNYTTYNGESKAIGYIILENHNYDAGQVKKTLENYHHNEELPLLFTDGNEYTENQIADAITEWFDESFNESHKEIFKVIELYRGKLDIGGREQHI
jgi:DNA repair exonuclease SbcCD ATPase subunit